jgi:5-oxoprolinase (ATP-hydrolysing) subunit C
VSASLAILRAGPLCTLQDEGRRGWLRYGVTPAGPMDWVAYQTANKLAGNQAGAAAIEIGPAGMAVQAAGGALRLGISAEGFVVDRDGAPVAECSGMILMPGETLSISPGPSHVWAYLAVGGGLDFAPVMGSLSTHIRSGIGPLGGRALAAGDELPVAAQGRSIDRQPPILPSRPSPPEPLLRFVLGPQAEHVTEAALATFCSTPYRISRNSDRMGYRLDGPALKHSGGHDIVSDGVAMGSIQIPGDGLPIVLMADRQPTGGYPKIGVVIKADLPLLAQSRAGSAVRFEIVSTDIAVGALRQTLRELESIG